ncbi:ATP-binding protein [Clostridium sp. OS1-26]|uniref:hybrid sensor histidine kinase/response regulator n=1 Tax=Clostridium sp. OS1-26 TaxID=3070681 RepID=UPI0027E03997|nr:ATP-binding protein [Clostridium sp. OS1-26]WML36687.1 ATP-binding protein [Clostridium sp. OS1-26]
MLPSQGYATYRVRVKIKEIDKALYGIKTTRIRESNRIFINGKEVGHSGIPGKSYEETIPKILPQTDLTEISGNTVEIIIQVSNFRYSNGGIFHSIYFGNYRGITAFREYSIAMDVLICTGYLFMGIYFIGFYIQRKKQSEFLSFALYCIFSALYLLFNGEKLIFAIIPNLPYEMYHKLITLSGSLSTYFTYLYIYNLYEELYSKKVLKFFQMCITFDMILVLTTPLYFFSSLYPIFGLVTAIGIIYNIFVMIRGVLRAEKEYVYAITSTICFIEMQLVVLLATFWKLDISFIPPVTIPLFILSQGLLMSQRFTITYEKVEELSEKLTIIDKMKDEFMATVSHELRTPLNGIINISQSLVNGGAGKINTEQQENLTIIAHMGRRLSNLVNDILDYSKMKNGNIILYKSSVDLEAVVSLVFKILGYTIKNKKLRFESNIESGSFLVWADENRLKQIMYNLIENAVKFTKEGTITVSASKVKGNIHISVRDTGIGMPKEMHEDIFKSFEQVNPKDTSEYRGTGLGLSITRQLVEIHGGKIWVVSEEGVGSEFIFTLKESKKKNVDLKEDNLYKEPIILDKLIIEEQTIFKHNIGGEFSILAVDDEKANLKVLLNVLLMEKFNVTAVTSGQEALKELEGGLKYDLCILDLMMPRISGIEVCKKIRQKYSALDLPVLMLTAKSEPNDLLLGFEAGANDFLVKPYNLEEMKARVNTLLQLRKSVGSVIASETAFLQAQIKPHFLYNALSAIASLTTREPLKAKELILDLSDYLRGSFNFDRKDDFVLISKELATVNAYLSIEKARFKDRLKIEIYAGEDTNIKIPQLIIQPLVENAVRHGILEKTEGGTVKLSIQRDQSYVYIKIEDDGIGIPQDRISQIINGKDKKAGVGLANINRRLINYYGYGLEIESAIGIGTKAFMKIPIERV